MINIPEFPKYDTASFTSLTGYSKEELLAHIEKLNRELPKIITDPALPENMICVAANNELTFHKWELNEDDESATITSFTIKPPLREPKWEL
jgi:hypothetical protein